MTTISSRQPPAGIDIEKLRDACTTRQIQVSIFAKRLLAVVSIVVAVVAFIFIHSMIGKLVVLAALALALTKLYKASKTLFIKSTYYEIVRKLIEESEKTDLADKPFTEFLKKQDPKNCTIATVADIYRTYQKQLVRDLSKAVSALRALEKRGSTESV